MTKFPKDISKLKQCMDEGKHIPMKGLVKKTLAMRIEVPFECASGDILHACARCGLLYIEGPK